jgi:hypothetical protein
LVPPAPANSSPRVVPLEQPAGAVVPGKPPGAAARPGRIRGWADAIALAVLLAVPVAVSLWGWRYYALGPAGRLRHALHPLLKPAGSVGLALGVAGFALFLFMWLYVLRKHVRWLAWTGAVGSWLRVHIVVGLSLPVVVAAHAGWRFDGLIGLGYFAMLVVAISGVVGRYLYTRIPRRQSGVEMSLDEVGQERRALLTRIAAATGLEPAAVERALALDPAPYQGLDPVRAVVRMVRDDLQRARLIRRLRDQWSRPRAGTARLDSRSLAETLRLARREIALQQEARLLEATRRLFGAWHVFHRPFAATALLAVVVHVIVAVVVGGVSLWGAPR